MKLSFPVASRKLVATALLVGSSFIFRRISRLCKYKSTSPLFKLLELVGAHHFLLTRADLKSVDSGLRVKWASTGLF